MVLGSAGGWGGEERWVCVWLVGDGHVGEQIRGRRGSAGHWVLPESAFGSGGGVLIQGVRKSSRTRVFKIAMVLFCELHLGLTKLDMRVRLFFHCWTMQSHLS